MAFQLSPGVNVSEIDLTTVVPAVATTEGAIAGVFRWGPTDEPVLIGSEIDLVNRFGKPFANTTWSNAETFFTAANFLSYSDALYVQRVHDNGAKSGGTNFEGAYVGKLGDDIEVAWCDNASFAGTTVSEVLNIPASSAIGTIDVAQATSTHGITEGQSVIAGGQELVVTDVSDSSNSTHTTSTITFDKKFVGTAAHAEASFVRQWAYASSFDAAPVAGAGGKGYHIVVLDKGGFTGTAGVLEKFENLGDTATDKNFDGSTSFINQVLENSSNYIRVKSGANFATGQAVEALAGGSDGDSETDIGAGPIGLGWDKFKAAENIDVSLLLTGHPDIVVQNYVIDNIAETRKDCIAFITPDVPNTASAQDIVTAVATLSSSSYAVVDSGHKYQYDKYNDVYRWIPLNGDVAGLCARTDDARDPWFSPAGYSRGGIKNVVKLALNPTKTDRDLLYKNGVNPVITQAGQGTLLFGDKTYLNQPSAFDRINVRRLFIVLEKAISTASKSTLFEFNDEFTRAQFRNLVEPFLRDVQGRRGIYDFRVVCDETNNTSQVIDSNQFVGDIYIKPARAINFIQLNFVAVRTGVEFSEIVGQ
jgi:phage tail sheath protein FI